MLHRLEKVKIVLLLISLYPHVVSAQDWERYSHDGILPHDSIEIYYRYINKDGADYLEFKGVTYINSDLTVLSAVLRDVENMHKWVYNVESAESNIVSETEQYTYMVHKSIRLIFKQRDSYVHSFISQNPINLEVTINGSSAPNNIPKVNKYIRIDKGESTWKFTPVNKYRSKVVFQGYANPGGWISSSLLTPLAKSELWKLPYFSLKGLRIQVKEVKYKEVEYSFIRNF